MMDDRRTIDEDRVRQLLREGRELEAEAPAFQHMWERAARHQGQRNRFGLRQRWAALAAVTVALLVGCSLIWLAQVRSSRHTREFDALLANIQEIETTLPLEFLLETPGAELMYTTPRIGESLLSIDLDLSQFQENDS